MGLASFLYGEWDATSALTEAQDELIKACVALEDGVADSDTAMAITSGYRAVWQGAAEILAFEQDEPEPEWLSEPQAERFYRERFLKVYVRTVRRSYPKYETDGDGLGWWPESLHLDSLWPRKLLGRVAETMGAVEGERAVAMSRHFEREDAEQQASAKD
jgi:hypothetical protein